MPSSRGSWNGTSQSWGGYAGWERNGVRRLQREGGQWEETAYETDDRSCSAKVATAFTRSPDRGEARCPFCDFRFNDVLQRRLGNNSGDMA